MKKNSSQILHKQSQNDGYQQTGLLTMFSISTPAEIFDIRCEYEVPRYFDLNSLDDDEFTLDLIGSTSYYGLNEVWPPERKQSTTGGVRPPPLQHLTQEEEFY